jgi:hypothetical protein
MPPAATLARRSGASTPESGRWGWVSRRGRNIRPWTRHRSPFRVLTVTRGCGDRSSAARRIRFLRSRREVSTQLTALLADPTRAARGWNPSRIRHASAAAPAGGHPVGLDRFRTGSPILKCHWNWRPLLNAGNRCADRRFPRSRPTVVARGMRSVRLQVCVPPKGVGYRWRCPPHCLGLIAALHHCSPARRPTAPPRLLDALGLRPARYSASPAALTCPVGGVA